MCLIFVLFSWQIRLHADSKQESRNGLAGVFYFSGRLHSCSLLSFFLSNADPSLPAYIVCLRDGYHLVFRGFRIYLAQLTAKATTYRGHNA